MYISGLGINFHVVGKQLLLYTMQKQFATSPASHKQSGGDRVPFIYNYFVDRPWYMSRAGKGITYTVAM